MFRSIYGRMLVTYILIAVFIVFFQSVILIQLLRNNYVDASTEIAVNNAENLSKDVTRENDLEKLSVHDLVDVLKTYSSEDESLWLVSRKSLIIDVSQNDNLYYNKDAISRISDKTLKGETISFVDKFNKSIYASTMTVATPLYIDGEIEYALIIHTPLDPSKGVNFAFYRHIIASGLIAIIICAILVSISSRHISYPINQLSKMCVGISNGNYAAKIHTTSEDEIGQLAQSFNDMSDQLQRHDELRTNFVANVSHELRSPITSIHGYAQGMYDGTIEVDQYKKYSGIILDETLRLKKLISELLDLSQIDSGEFPLHFREVDINEQIRRVIIKYIDRMDAKDIELEVDFEDEYAKVYADSDRIDQILVNLVDNAIKFTPKNGKISVSTRKENEKIFVAVSDSGCGISPEDIGNVFERFYKSDKSHTDKVGTGLGLSIVKKILDQHGEKITVASELGKGTKFEFTLTSIDIE